MSRRDDIEDGMGFAGHAPARDTYEEKLSAQVKSLRTENEELRDKLNLARAYRGLEARACPLCTYENGKFIKACSMHEQIEELRKQLADTQQDLHDARDGWEAAVELNRELEQQLAQARGQALEEAGELAYAYLTDRGLGYVGGYTHATALQSEIRALSQPTEAKSTNDGQACAWGIACWRKSDGDPQAGKYYNMFCPGCGKPVAAPSTDSPTEE